MAKYDEYYDEKFLGMLRTGELKPWDNHLDLLKCIAMACGTHLGFRGKQEMVFSKWSYFKLVTLPNGIRQVTAAPSGRFDKTNNLSMNNPLCRKGFPYSNDLPEDANHPVKLFFHYRKLCDPKQDRFFCHVAVSPSAGGYKFAAKKEGWYRYSWKMDTYCS